MASGPDLEAAIQYVHSKGSTVEQAWLKILLGHALSDEELVAVTANQNPDGGFRARETGAHSVVGRTAEMLLYFAALGAGEFGAAQAAADFLIENQRPDGSWGESRALAASNPPPHFAPDSIDVQGWETAATIVALSGLGLSLDYRPPLEFLRSSRLHLRGQRNFALETLVIYAAFRRIEGAESAALNDLRAERALSHPDSLEVFELNWGLYSLGLAASEDPLVGAFGESLAKHQRPDGGFGSGPQASPYETVLALGALEMAGLVTIPRASAPTGDEPDPAESDRTI